MAALSNPSRPLSIHLLNRVRLDSVRVRRTDSWSPPASAFRLVVMLSRRVSRVMMPVFSVVTVPLAATLPLAPLTLDTVSPPHRDATQLGLFGSLTTPDGVVVLPPVTHALEQPGQAAPADDRRALPVGEPVTLRLDAPGFELALRLEVEAQVALARAPAAAGVLRALDDEALRAL